MHHLPVGDDWRVFDRQYGNAFVGRMRQRVRRHQRQAQATCHRLSDGFVAAQLQARTKRQAMAGEEDFCRLTCARAGLTQDELLVGQRTQRHATETGQRMVGSGDHHQRVGEKGRGDDRRRQRWATHDVEVVEVVRQATQHGVTVQHHQ